MSSSSSSSSSNVAAATCISGNGGSGGGPGGGKQELRGLSREISKLVAVSNPGPRFSALPTFSESDEENSNGGGGDGEGVAPRKKRRQRGAGRSTFVGGIGASSAPPSVATAGSGAGLQYQQQHSGQQMAHQHQNVMAQSDCIYDSQGRIVANGQDACDCLTLGCPGCYFPCSRCGGSKCGYECRVGRNSFVKQITVESLGDLKIRNRLIVDDDDRDK